MFKKQNFFLKTKSENLKSYFFCCYLKWFGEVLFFAAASILELPDKGSWYYYGHNYKNLIEWLCILFKNYIYFKEIWKNVFWNFVLNSEN